MSSVRRPYWSLILGFAAVKLLLQFYASGSYHYFRDELYFIACGRHLDWGFVDHPPLVALYARFGEWLSSLFGESLRAFRFLATFAGAVRVVLTGVLAARLGGGRAAQALACLAVLVAPVYLGMDGLLSMNTIEHLFWLACILIVLEISNGASEKWWLAFGVLAGLGLQNKHSMAFLGAAIVGGMLLTPMRRSLLRPWIWLGGAIALLIFLPNLIWEYRHDFATLELLRNVKETGKNVVLPPGPFMVQQAMMVNIFALPLWLAGLWALFREPRHRVLGWTYVIVLIVMIRLEAKNYYVAPIYPMLFAAGAVWFASKRRFVYATVGALALIGGLISLPLALPLTSPERYLAYQRALGEKPKPTEVSHNSEMPQRLADQFGWEEMVVKVARYYNSLPPEERKRTAIFAGNYGEAGAIDFYGPKYGLPPAISGHQNYYLWGPRDTDGSSIIVIGDDEPNPEMWESIIEFDRTNHPYAMPAENGPLHHGRGLKSPVAKVWPQVKQWR
jgi:hypothetical protein